MGMYINIYLFIAKRNKGPRRGKVGKQNFILISSLQMDFNQYKG